MTQWGTANCQQTTHQCYLKDSGCPQLRTGIQKKTTGQFFTEIFGQPVTEVSLSLNG